MARVFSFGASRGPWSSELLIDRSWSALRRLTTLPANCLPRVALLRLRRRTGWLVWASHRCRARRSRRVTYQCGFLLMGCCHDSGPVAPPQAQIKSRCRVSSATPSPRNRLPECTGARPVCRRQSATLQTCQAFAVRSSSDDRIRRRHGSTPSLIVVLRRRSAWRYMVSPDGTFRGCRAPRPCSVRSPERVRRPTIAVISEIRCPEVREPFHPDAGRSIVAVSICGRCDRA